MSALAPRTAQPCSEPQKRVALETNTIEQVMSSGRFLLGYAMHLRAKAIRSSIVRRGLGMRSCPQEHHLHPDALLSGKSRRSQHAVKYPSPAVGLMSCINRRAVVLLPGGFTYHARTADGTSSQSGLQRAPHRPCRKIFL
jgi:hypothetical protein